MTEKQIRVGNELYLGRLTEQDQFRRALHQVSVTKVDSNELPFIFLIHGEGGMGKTQLTHRMFDIATTEFPFEREFKVLRLDWQSIRYTTIALQVPYEQIQAETVLEVLHQAALDKGWGLKFSEYQTCLKRQSEIEQKIAEDLQELGQQKDNAQYIEILNLGASGLAKLVRQFVPVIGQAGEDISQAALSFTIQAGAESLAHLRMKATRFLKSKLNPEQYDIYLNPLEQLARALARGFKNVSRDHPVVLFLDTYEIVSRTDAWLRQVIKASGPRMIWVIAGRDNLIKNHPQDKYFVGYNIEFSRNLFSMDIQELAIEHVKAYLSDRAPSRIPTIEEATAVFQTTRGVPLAIHQAGDLWAQGIPLDNIVEQTPNNPTSRSMIVREMHRRVLQHVESSAGNEADKIALYMLAMQPRPNDRVQRNILCSESQNDLGSHLEQLAQRYSTVELVGSGARLHEAMASFLQEHLMTSEMRHSELVLRIADKAVETLQRYRNELLDDLFDLEEIVASEDWQKTTLELIHWMFWKNEQLAWREVVPRFVEGLGYQKSFASAIITVVNQFKPLLNMNGHKRLLQLQLDDDNREIMLEELERLAHKGRWLDDDNSEATAKRLAILRMQRGEWLSKQNKYDKALEIYQSAEELLPEDATYLREQIGNALIDINSRLSWFGEVASYSTPSNDSLKIAQHAVTLNSQSKEAWHHLASTYMELGLNKEAEEAEKKAIKLDPQYIDAWYQLGGFIYPVLSKVKEAEIASQTTVKILKEQIELKPNDAAHWNLLGLTYSHMGELENAIEAFKKSLDIDPGMYVCWHNMGQAYQGLRRYDEAIKAYKNAIETEPRYAVPRDALGSLYRHLGEYEESIEYFQQAISLEPYQYLHYSGLGNTYMEMEDYDKAEAIYLEGLKHCDVDAKRATIYGKLGSLREQQGKLEDALDYFKQVIELQPDSQWNMNLASILRKLGQNDEAAKYYTHARQMLADDDYYNLACLEALMTNSEEALEYLDKALNPRPDMKEWASRDPDLKSLHNDPRFRELVSVDT